MDEQNSNQNVNSPLPEETPKEPSPLSEAPEVGLPSGLLPANQGGEEAPLVPEEAPKEIGALPQEAEPLSPEGESPAETEEAKYRAPAPGVMPESIKKSEEIVKRVAAPRSEGEIFETPELAKKEIIERAVGAEGAPGEMIYVMPEKFRKAKRKAAPVKIGGKKVTVLIIALIGILIVGGGIGFYFWAKEYLGREAEPIAPLVKPETPPKEKVEEPEVFVSAEQTLKFEIKDETSGDILSSAEFYLPAGALGEGVALEISGQSSAEEDFPDYKVIGGLYKIEPVDTAFQKTCQLKIFYDESLVKKDWELNIVLGYFKDNLWTPLTGSLDKEANLLSANLEFLPSDTLAAIIDKSKLVSRIEIFQVAPHIPSSADQDSDGLTDIEEGIYRTLVNNPDSDTGGDSDGQEVINLMDPLQSGETKLAAAGLVNIYTNPTYSYSFFYPSSWIARAIPETNNQEVLVITSTGEFFSATVEDNPEELSPTEWYLRQSPKTDTSLLATITVNNQPAVWSPDHLTIYITKGTQVYVLSYNVGVEKEANFKATFKMLINSFQFVAKPEGKPDGALIKYPGKAEVYLIEKGKKRAFASGEIFEKLGFKWEDVIEIPFSETYLDGESVTGRLDGALIKYPESGIVYLIENGKKRPFKSGQVFEDLGYKWEDVIEIPASETYPDGAAIESGTVAPSA